MKTLRLLLPSTILGLCTSALILPAETLRYQEVTEAVTNFSTVTILRRGTIPFQVAVTNHKGHSLFELDSHGYTLAWQFSHPKEPTTFQVRRKGHRLLGEGTLEGEPLSIDVELDEGPWIQAIDFCFQRFMGSGEERMKYWILRQNDLKLFKFRAYNLGLEEIEMPGGKEKAYAIKVTLDGAFMSKIWHALYWYDRSDKTFIKYRAKNGPPSAPITITQLVSRKK